MKIITKQQFDALKVGDELKSDINNTILVVQGTIGEIIIVKSINAEVDDNEIYFSSCTYCIEELISGEYSIIHQIQHNCGFPYGDYSDKEVIVKVSDKSIEDCTVNAMYTRLIYVDNEGFTDHNGEHWMYAVLVANNVDIIVKP